MTQDPLQLRLNKWFMRKSPSGALSRIAQAPLVLSSNIGRVRMENQDRVAVLRAQVSPTRSFLVAVLCDGMGGMKDGAGCAALAVSAFLNSCIRNRTLDPLERLQVAVQSANTCVYDEYHQEGGTTLSAFLIDSDSEFVAVNIGDSRIYSFSDNKLDQISKDDTLSGQIGGRDKMSILNNGLLQYIGIGADLDPHIISTPDINSDSTIIMSSDGTHFINQSSMESIVRNAEKPAEIAHRLIDLAMWCGGKDNASIVVANRLSTILTTNDEDTPPTGSVQIWDSFSELHLIGVEKIEASSILANPSNSPKVGKEDKAVLVKEKDIGSAKTKEKNKQSADDRNAQHEKDDELDEPQIRIDFE